MAEGGVIVDSAMDFPGGIVGTSAPLEVIEVLCLISVRYVGFDGRRYEGQLVVHRELAADLGEIFALMETLKFPVAGVVPIVRYGWSDEASMVANNASAFNYRTVAGTDRLSCHATGRAVDINPRWNPAIYPDGRIAPMGAVYRPGNPGTFTDEHPVVFAFRERGWRWGGHFTHMKDYHHFEKREAEETVRKERLY
ncbi:MAG: M15 family metallopeptidase [Syntrophales bacterium]|nr:M15 family metallopeptidase [Syntrophales bacterium]